MWLYINSEAINFSTVAWMSYTDTQFLLLPIEGTLKKFNCVDAKGVFEFIMKQLTIGKNVIIVNTEICSRCK